MILMVELTYKYKCHKNDIFNKYLSFISIKTTRKKIEINDDKLLGLANKKTLLVNKNKL